MNQPAGGNTIILTQPSRWYKDVADFRRAVSEAEKIDFPSRVKLYDLYNTVLLDTHLSSVLEKRKSAILCSQMEFSRNGKPDARIGEMLESPWFRQFLSDLLDTPWWGFSLFQFYPDKSGWLAYDLVPRKHVDPINELIVRHQTDIHGTPWADFGDLLSVGEPRGLGNLIKVVPWVLYKQGTASDWVQFAEIFGQPIREYTYDGEDDTMRRRILNDEFESGSTAVFIHSSDSNFNLVEAANKTGSCELYSKLVETCNSETSKLVLGNTLTTEVGERGTQALGTVHQEEEDMITQADKVFVLNTLNYDMTDIFESFGINVKGGKFAFVTPQNRDLSQRISVDMQLASNGLPIDDDYWYETYGVPRPANYDELKAKQEEQRQQAQQTAAAAVAAGAEKDKPKPVKPDPAKGIKNALRGFF